MSLVSHWKDRKKFLGTRTRGRPLWWLIMMLLVVLTVMHLLDKWGGILEERMTGPGHTTVQQDE